MQDISQQARAHGDLFLPLRRSNEGLADDAAYLQSAIEQIQALARHHPISADTRVLDFGCGQGRFANGLLALGQPIGHYCGIDTDQAAIQWCRHWIKRDRTDFTFEHVSAHNARYNPTAPVRPDLPVVPACFDMAFANSVFSHMDADDAGFYLRQLHRALRAGGVVYLTAFVEPDVPPVQENPPDYLGRSSSGPLHRVCYERSYFLGLVEAAGFGLIAFEHQGIERTRQSVIVARRLG